MLLVECEVFAEWTGLDWTGPERSGAEWSGVELNVGWAEPGALLSE